MFPVQIAVSKKIGIFGCEMRILKVLLKLIKLTQHVRLIWGVDLETTTYLNFYFIPHMIWNQGLGSKSQSLHTICVTWANAFPLLSMSFLLCELEP